MSQATPVRLGDLHRGKAWPFLSWLILEGQLRPDVELLLGKPGGTGLPTEWATRHGADRDRLIRAGRQLGWSENWVRQVSLLAASTLCLHAGVPLDGLRDEHFTDLLAELDRAGCVSVSARRKVRTRLFALRQACYQLGVLARPPRKGGPVAGTPAEHARAVRQPEVRPEVVRYVTTISTTLRPTTVAGRTKALLPSSTTWPTSTRRSAVSTSSSAPPTSSPTSPGCGIGPGGAPTAGGEPSRSALSTRTWLTCGASSTTSPAGGGRRRRRAGCCLPPTFPGCPNRCPARCLPTSTGR